MKKFLIAVGAVVSALAIAVIVVVSVLSTKYTKVDFEFAQPSKIEIYNKSDKSTQLTKDDANFEKIIDALNNSMQLSKLDQISKNKEINTKVRVVEEELKWSASLKNSNICIQLNYDDEQTLVIYEGQNSKQIKYKYLMIVLTEENGLIDHNIYYSNSTIFEKTGFCVQFDEKYVKNYV